MTSTTSKSPYREGALAALPFIFVVAPFGLLFGIVASDAGLALVETMAMTTLVIAGASQFTAVQLMTENAPVWITVSLALCVNLRMAMYSASLQPYFREATFWQRVWVALGNFDQSYALGVTKFDASPEMSPTDRVRFFVSAVGVIASVWVTTSFLGAVFGRVFLPDTLPIDFAMPIMFLAIVAPMLKTAAHLAAAATSIVVALAFAWLPSGTGVLIAGLAAMAVGAEIERRGYGP